MAREVGNDMPGFFFFFFFLPSKNSQNLLPLTSSLARADGGACADGVGLRFPVSVCRLFKKSQCQLPLPGRGSRDRARCRFPRALEPKWLRTPVAT
mmetsp:Transcript_2052/g.1632  ORF Transcript_2052/g.1632 Transcript_2052/m.1632 type:complete len:96 (+) Transcript_2052:37-324(+)